MGSRWWPVRCWSCRWPLATLCCCCRSLHVSCRELLRKEPGAVGVDSGDLGKLPQFVLGSGRLRGRLPVSQRTKMRQLLGKKARALGMDVRCLLRREPREPKSPRCLPVAGRRVTCGMIRWEGAGPARARGRACGLCGPREDIAVSVGWWRPGRTSSRPGGRLAWLAMLVHEDEIEVGR